MKESAGLLKWRRKQPRGAIMSPETFEKIRRSALAQKLSPESAAKVAGRAYWNTAERKYKNARKD